MAQCVYMCEVYDNEILSTIRSESVIFYNFMNAERWAKERLLDSKSNKSRCVKIYQLITGENLNIKLFSTIYDPVTTSVLVIQKYS